VVRAADIHKRQRVGAVEQLVRHAPIGHGLPDDQRPRRRLGGLGPPAGQEVTDQLPTARRRADDVEGARAQQRARQVVGGQTLLGRRVPELAAARVVGVAVPAARGQPVGRGPEDGAGGPAVDQVGQRLREVGPLVDDPPYGAAERGRGEEPGAEGGPGSRSAEDVADGRLWWGEFNLIC